MIPARAPSPHSDAPANAAVAAAATSTAHAPGVGPHRGALLQGRLELQLLNARLLLLRRQRLKRLQVHLAERLLRGVRQRWGAVRGGGGLEMLKSGQTKVEDKRGEITATQ